MALTTSQKIIANLEQSITNDETPTLITNDKILFIRKTINRIKVEILYPCKLLFNGFGIFLRDVIKFYILLIIAFLILSAFDITVLETKEKYSLLAIFFLFTLVSSIFSAPSSYVTCGIKRKNIDNVEETLAKQKIVNSNQLNAIRSNLSLLQEVMNTRLKKLRTILVLYGGFIVYILNKSLESESKFTQEVQDNTILFLCIVFLFSYLALESYSKIKMLIFNAAQMGCNEYEFNNLSL